MFIKLVKSLLVVQFSTCVLRRRRRLRFWRTGCKYWAMMLLGRQRFVAGLSVLDKEPPKRVTIPELVEKDHSVGLGDRRVKVEEIARIVSMSKLATRWLPCLLNGGKQNANFQRQFEAF